MADDDFTTIAIVGLGLIGGSLGLALHRAWPDVTIVGWDHRAETRAAARERGAITHAAPTLEAAVSDVDLVIVATPVLAVKDVFEAIAPHLKPDAIVSDVASTKAQIAQWAEAIFPDSVTFIGGHPMAGSEQHGIAHARADLFGGAVYCLTPSDTTPPAAMARLDQIANQIGAHPLHIDAMTHDMYVAAISHLPFVLSAALVQQTSADDRWPQMRQLAATGFRDTTRLASGDVRMHRDICLTNAPAIRAQLLGMAHLLEQIADHLGDPEYLQRLFENAKRERDDWIDFTTESQRK